MKPVFKPFLSIIIMVFAVTVSVMTTSGCQLESQNQTNTGWFIYNYQNGKYYQKDVLLRYTGLHCSVYVTSNDMGSLSVGQAQSVANEFDNNVYSKITNKFGTEPDVDSDGKVTILVLDIIDGWTPGNGYVAGFFDPRQEQDVLYSNKKDMLYMDCNPGTVDDDTFRVTMAHEFQHMINYNQKVFVQGVGKQDTWINEGLSSAAETVYCGSNIQTKINYYNSDGSGAGDISAGTAFVYWQNNLPNYSTVYLFFQWLRWQASNNDGIFKEIINNSAVDYSAVLAAAQNRVTNGTWDDIIRYWYIANVFTNTTGILGYKGNIATSVHYLGFSGSYPLNPGEGVYQAIAVSKTATPAGTINYAGLNLSTKSVSNVGTTFYGNRFLAYNNNGNPTGGSGSANLSIESLTKGLVPVPDVPLSPSLIKFGQDFRSGKIKFPIDPVIGMNQDLNKKKK